MHNWKKKCILGGKKEFYGSYLLTIHPHPYYTWSDLKLIGRRERWAHRPEQQEEAPPHSLPSPAPSRDIGKPLERQVAKLRHTSPDTQARTIKLYVSSHKGEGAWNIIFLLMTLIKGEQSTCWEQFPAGLSDEGLTWSDSEHDQPAAPGSQLLENCRPLPNAASPSKRSWYFLHKIKIFQPNIYMNLTNLYLGILTLKTLNNWKWKEMYQHIWINYIKRNRLNNKFKRN